jgi:hypothetical protein
MTEEQFLWWIQARISATKAAQKKCKSGTPKYISLGGKLTALKSVLDFAKTHA